jgi:hypothetical protein
MLWAPSTSPGAISKVETFAHIGFTKVNPNTNSSTKSISKDHLVLVKTRKTAALTSAPSEYPTQPVNPEKSQPIQCGKGNCFYYFSRDLS